MSDRFLADDFLLSTETARPLFHDVARKPADRRPPQPSAGRGHRRDRVFADLTRALARGRPLQVARDAARGRRGAARDGRRRALGALLGLGRDRAALSAIRSTSGRTSSCGASFGIDLPLGPATAREIWDEANRQLPPLPARALLARFGVAALATTDDPGRRSRRPSRAARRSRRAHRDPDASPRCGARGCSATCLPGTAGPTGSRQATGLAVDDLESLLAALTACARALRRSRRRARATTGSPGSPTPRATRRPPMRRSAARAG